MDWIPKVQDGCIHMEDLSQRGKCLSYYESVNLTQIKAFIRVLARMHKNILSQETKEWRGTFLENITLFGDLLDSADLFIDKFLENCKRRSEFRESRNVGFGI